MSDCELCKQGDPSVNVRCWSCRETFHLHKSQIDLVEEGGIVVADCPKCELANCWQKRGEGVIYSGPISYDGEPVYDFREKGAQK